MPARRRLPPPFPFLAAIQALVTALLISINPIDII
jgi:hypothetical protein